MGGVGVLLPRYRPGSRRQAESHNRISAQAVSVMKFLHEGRLQIMRVGVDRAGCNFLVCRSAEAEFANTQSRFGAHRRPKNPTGHRTRFIEFTGSRLRIESRARFVICKFKELFCGPAALMQVALMQQACRWIAGEFRRQPRDGFARAFSYAGGTFRGLLLKIAESLLQPGRIELVDRKGTYTALRATGTTDKPMAASPGGISKRRIHDLDQGLVPSWTSANLHLKRIMHRKTSAE